MQKTVGSVLLWLGILCIPLQAQQVVISQIYGGGGNSGATLKNDFVELFNAGSTTIDVTGWSVQYASSAGSAWQTTGLTGILQPGQYYLVEEAAGSGGSQALPAPDTTGSINMNATTGKIALVNTSDTLTGACPIGNNVVDFVGYGSTVNCSRGTPTNALSNTSAALRKRDGCQNTGSNANDFAIANPNPRNTNSAWKACSSDAGITISPASLPNATVNLLYSAALTASGGTGPYTFAILGNLPDGIALSSNGVIGGTATASSSYSFTIIAQDAYGATGSANYSLQVDAAASCNITHTIAEVQGSGAQSPLEGKTVTVNGIVTVSVSNGFFIQMPAPGDGDPATSDGIFVYTGSGRLPAIAQGGNQVCVTGPVAEFVPSSDSNSPPKTEINVPSNVTLLSVDNALPLPVVLTADDTNPHGPFNQLRKYEGMRVQANTLNAVAPTGGTVDESNATSASNGVFYGVLPGIARPFREPGVQLPDPLPPGSPCCVVRWDSNPEVLRVDSSLLSSKLEVTAGATVTNLIGPLDYLNRSYTIIVEPSSGAAATGNVSVTSAPLADPSQLTIAAFNLEHFYNASGPDTGTSHATLTAIAYANRLNKASLVIRNVLHTPDILAVEELQNLTTLQDLANKVNSDSAANGQPSPNYGPYLQGGNDISGINSGFLVKTPKVTVNTVTQYGKNATYTTPSGSQAILNDRPPLVLSATVLRDGSDASLPVTVIVNHLRSLLDLDDPATGPTVRAKREAQAEYLANLIQSFQTADHAANIVSVGDYNAYQFSDGYVDTVGEIKGVPVAADQVVLSGPHLVDPTLTNLIDTDLISPGERYSYSFDGSAQAIDHIIVNNNMLARATKLVYGRVDADFPESLRNDPTRPERVSDHDPVEAFFTLPLGVTGKVQISGSGFAYSRLTHTYVGTVTLTNVSNINLSGPLYLQFNNLPSGVTLSNGAGLNYVIATSTGLTARQSTTVQIQFNDPSNIQITYSPVVYAGSM